MSAPRWTPSVDLSKREERVMRRLTRHRKLFAFLRLQRHAIFDDAFQNELCAIYRDTGEGKEPLPPALLAMATIMQAYAGVSDAEAVENATFDARWQLVLGTLGDEDPPFSQGALSAFRERMIKHDLDRRVLERTIELARATKGFDYKKLPRVRRLAVDSRPLSGAGRVEDTVNLLGRAGRQLLMCAAAIADIAPSALAQKIGATLLIDSSIKAALDIDWNDLEQRTDAMERLLAAIDSIEKFVRERLAEHADGKPLSEHLVTIALLREQNIDPEPPDGGGPRVRDGVAPDRTVSLSDPEMRHGRKSTNRTFNGFKNHVATDLDVGVVLACAVLPANRPEREGLDAMREDIARVAGNELAIEELHIDRGYTSAELTQRLVESGARLLSKPRTPNGRTGFFDKNDFVIDLRKKIATCPAGQKASIVLGAPAQFDAKTCSVCRKKKACTTSKSG